jgi:hypothetical protein
MRSHRSSYPARFPGCICSTMENAFHKNHVGGRGLSLWSQLCACGSALGLSGSGSCGSGLAGSGDIDHVRVIQPVTGPGRPCTPRSLEPTTDLVFVGTHFPPCYKCSREIGPDNWIKLSGPGDERPQDLRSQLNIRTFTYKHTHIIHITRL